MSGWDQRYDLESWEQDKKNLHRSAVKFQRDNKLMRWVLIVAAAVLFAFGYLFGTLGGWAGGVAFTLLFLINEWLINRMQRDGFQ